MTKIVRPLGIDCQHPDDSNLFWGLATRTVSIARGLNWQQALDVVNEQGLRLLLNRRGQYVCTTCNRASKNLGVFDRPAPDRIIAYFACNRCVRQENISATEKTLLMIEHLTCNGTTK